MKCSEKCGFKPQFWMKVFNFFFGCGHPHTFIPGSIFHCPCGEEVMD